MARSPKRTASQSPAAPPAAEHGASPANLSEGENDEVASRSAASPRVVHEVIRSQGDEELDRPLLSLLFSGIAAGVSISASVLAEGALAAGLPKDAAWTPLLTSLGYTVGFVIAILGRLQLFTETTVTAVLPVATQPTLANVGRLLRLWAIVFAANMIGTGLVALMIAKGLIVSPGLRDAIIALSRHAIDHPPTHVVWLGIPAGFLIASVAWILPNARGSEFWVVMLITWTVSLCGFSHVVAGSAEAFTVWLSGGSSFGAAVGGFILPALLGNIIGGTGLFAVLAHGQVRGEMPD